MKLDRPTLISDKEPYIYGYKQISHYINRNCNHNRKLEISRASTKGKSREPAYSRALNQNKIYRLGSGQDPESQAGRQSDGFGGWCLELRHGGRYEEVDESG